jgi:hypothetical protein
MPMVGARGGVVKRAALLAVLALKWALDESYEDVAEAPELGPAERGPG